MKSVLLIIIVGFLVYFNSLQNGFLLDDEEQILNNQLVHSIANLPQFFFGSTFNSGGSGDLIGIYFRPMMTTAFSLIYSIFGPNPLYFHLFSLLIHIANSIIIFLILKTFFPQSVSLISSLIFLVHPINSEAVNYISALQDLLSFFFGSLAILIFLRSKTTFNFFCSLALLLASLFSKESGILFIAVLLLKIWLFDKKFFLKYFLGSLTIVAIYLTIRLGIAQVSFSHDWVAPISQADLTIRLFTIPKELIYYFQTFIFPKDLSFSYHFLVQNPTLVNFYLPLTAIIILFLGLISFGKYLLASESKLAKSYLFFLSWLAIGLALHLNIFPLDMSVADHWFYSPMVGLLGILAITIKTFNLYKLWVFILIIILIIPFAFRTFLRNFDWKDGYTLYQHDLSVSPDSFDIQNNLAREFLKQGKYEQAKIHAQKSIDLIPYYWVSWNNLGVIHLKLNQIDEAKTAFEKSLTFSDFYQSYENLSGLLFLYDDPKIAKIFTQRALEKFPQNAKLWFNLSLIEYKLNNKQEAINAINASYQLDPLENTSKIRSQILKDQPLNLKITDYH